MTNKRDTVSTSTNQIGDQSATLNSSERKIVDELCDPDKDTQAEAMLKEAVIRVLHKGPKHRSKENLSILGSFLQRYEFFAKFKKTQTESTYKSLMRAVKIAWYEKDQYVILQGDTGDKFYVLLKGEAAVRKAFFAPVPGSSEQSDIQVQVYQFVVGLYKNYDNVFWGRVPYQSGLKRYLARIKRRISKMNLSEVGAQITIECDALPQNREEEEHSQIQTVVTSL